MDRRERRQVRRGAQLAAEGVDRRVKGRPQGRARDDKLRTELGLSDRGDRRRQTSASPSTEETSMTSNRGGCPTSIAGCRFGSRDDIGKAATCR